MNCRRGNYVKDGGCKGRTEPSPGRKVMPVIALITWIVTALGGLYLLAIWLIEYDPDFQRAAATRLPVPVISAHVLFALAGLGVWLLYLITDEDILASATIAILALLPTFGL